MESIVEITLSDVEEAWRLAAVESTYKEADEAWRDSAWAPVV